MPLTALLDSAVLLDATQHGLGAGRPWTTVHRVRPRVALTCPECGFSLYAKVSPAPRRLRYFAHKAKVRDCRLTGESMAHRLLKIELAAAVRAAGWTAELEVAGPNWRADVLATSPDGARRFAWEAQPASLTLDEIRERTTKLSASGLEVCWVTDAASAWLGHVPSVRIHSRTDLMVEDNVFRSTPPTARDGPSPPG